MWNILPVSEQEVANQTLEESVFTVDATAPFFYGMGGVRLVMPGKRVARPYVTASLGFASGSAHLSYTAEGRDVTTDVRVVGTAELPPLPDITLRETTDTLNLITALGGGVNLGQGTGLSFDVGYRYMRMFDTDVFQGNVVNIGRAYVAVGYAF